MAKDNIKKGSPTKYVFIRLKDRQSSAGQVVGSTHFNNATVECYEEGSVPALALIGIKNNVFEYCKEADYEVWIEAQKQQAEFFKRVQEQRINDKKLKAQKYKDSSIENAKMKEEIAEEAKEEAAKKIVGNKKTPKGEEEPEEEEKKTTK